MTTSEKKWSQEKLINHQRIVLEFVSKCWWCYILVGCEFLCLMHAHLCLLLHVWMCLFVCLFVDGLDCSHDPLDSLTCPLCSLPHCSEFVWIAVYYKTLSRFPSHLFEWWVMGTSRWGHQQQLCEWAQWERSSQQRRVHMERGEQRHRERRRAGCDQAPIQKRSGDVWRRSSEEEGVRYGEGKIREERKGTEKGEGWIPASSVSDRRALSACMTHVMCAPIVELQLSHRNQCSH